jgi:hypothetical protein
MLAVMFFALIFGAALTVLPAERAGPLVDLLAGLLIIFILSLIPLLGPLLLALLAILGFGAVVLTRAGSAGGWDLDLSEVRY